jgi:hypothetical protein
MNKREMLKGIIENWFVEKTSIKPTKEGLNNLVDRIYYSKQLTLGGVVSSAFLVQHKETLINYGLFSTREKAENYINKNTDLFGIQEVKIA